MEFHHINVKRRKVNWTQWNKYFGSDD